MIESRESCSSFDGEGMEPCILCISLCTFYGTLVQAIVLPRLV
jgi:hypothetical protein